MSIASHGSTSGRKTARPWVRDLTDVLFFGALLLALALAAIR
jgi:hypothetical protein